MCSHAPISTVIIMNAHTLAHSITHLHMHCPSQLAVYIHEFIIADDKKNTLDVCRMSHDHCHRSHDCCWYKDRDHMTNAVKDHMTTATNHMTTWLSFDWISNQVKGCQRIMGRGQITGYWVGQFKGHAH